MNVDLLLIAIAILLCGGLLCLAAAGRNAISNRLGAVVSVLGAIPAILSAGNVLLSGKSASISISWNIPFGSLNMAVDNLSAFFILAVAVICAVSAIFGSEYLKSYAARGSSWHGRPAHASQGHLAPAAFDVLAKQEEEEEEEEETTTGETPVGRMGKMPMPQEHMPQENAARKNLGVSWFFYNVLFASMLLVVVARNGIMFLVAWEVMSLASFFLVMFEHEKQAVREAGWTYLVATHLGTAFLLALFVMLGWQNQTLDFDKFSAPASQAVAGVMFLLAVVGFGTKAGFFPMHVWLPEAHPVAPSHVSAVMSGVMIKMGIYGLLRTLIYLGTPPTWWGWTLIAVGAASGIGGVLMALAQRDIKRLLAYSSVENIGIICLALGIWLLGKSTGNAAFATLGLLGGLLHVWNHAIFKSLLFLGAGAIIHATGTPDMEQMGGLLKRMKQTGLTILIASAAICGLPPLNGFVGEFVIYVAAFSGVTVSSSLQTAVAGLVAIGSLAIIGGLAVACFTKLYGTVFLGEARSQVVANAHEATKLMLTPLRVLAGLCVLIGLTGPLVVTAVVPTAKQLIMPDYTSETGFWITKAQYWLCCISLACLILAALAAALWLLRRRLLTGRVVEQAGTWDCGYAAPTARMQYTASSFAWPILNIFRWFLRMRVNRRLPQGPFPKSASLETDTPDVFRRYWYAPLFGVFGLLADRLRWLQQGRNQLYVLYIALTLLILLLWKLG